MKMNMGPTFSRRRFAVGLSCIVALQAAQAFAGGKRHTEEPTAREFLASIYERYRAKSSVAGPGIVLDAQSLRSYFTAGLASLILEDRAAALEHGESPVLESDPFIGRSEWDISNLSVDVKDMGALKAVGTVTFLNFGKPEKVILELLRLGNEWRVAEVKWDSGTLRGVYRRKAAYHPATEE